VSFLDEKGRPHIVERAYVIPPASQIGPITDAERSEFISSSLVAGVYEKSVDRESAYEKLKGRVEKEMPAAEQPKSAKGKEATQAEPQPSSGGGFTDALGGLFGGGGGVGRRKDTMMEAMIKSAARSIGSQVGREIIRGVLGSILKK